jgi:hypothetical protein
VITQGDGDVFHRFHAIHIKFGKKALFKTLILFIGLVVMSAMGLLLFSSVGAMTISVVGLVLGYLLREQIARHTEQFPLFIRVGLLTYPVILFLGKQLGITHNVQLLIITLTTVILFDLQFWSLSHPNVYAPE